MEKRLDAYAAPSRALEVTGGICWATMLLKGSARPRMALKFGAKGLSSTSEAAVV